MPALHRVQPELVNFTHTGVSGFPEIEQARVPPPLAPGNPIQTLWGIRRYQKETSAAVRDSKCDALLVPFTYEMLSRSPVPQTAFVLDMLPMRFPQWFPQMALFWRHHLAPALRRCPKIAVISENTKRDVMELLGIPGEKIKTIYLGFTPASGGGERRPITGRLLYVSSSHLPHKNVEGMLRAFAVVLERRPDATLRVIGKHHPRYTPSLRELAGTLGVSQAVSFEEDLDETELNAAYREADLFVYPTLYEGFGMPPLEAMAASVPVVASTTGAVAEVCGPAALAFDPTSSAGIAEAVLRGLSDDALRADLIQKGERRCRDFTWDATALNLVDWIDA